VISVQQQHSQTIRFVALITGQSKEILSRGGVSSQQQQPRPTVSRAAPPREIEKKKKVVIHQKENIYNRDGL
jgi:hypothetical protein